MLSKAQEKYIRALKLKKKRYELSQFIIEGGKLVEEAIQEREELICTFVTSEKVSHYKLMLNKLEDYIIISEGEMNLISQMDTPPGILSVVKMKKFDNDTTNFILAVESIKDPGNLGTIIRTAECFGVNQIWCSKDTVDHYNFKTVQASMGSIFRMPIHRLDLIEKLQNINHKLYVSHLDGGSLFNVSLSLPCVLVIGSESHGVSEQLEKMATELIKIPQKGKVESLNAAMACGIILSEFNRRFET